MLRQALDAEDQKRALESSLLLVEEETAQYGGISSSKTSSDIVANSSFDPEIDEEDEDEDDDDEEESLISEQPGTASILRRTWEALKSAVRVVANVENLWDTPPQEIRMHTQRRSNLVVLFWFVVLAISYAGERCTFKLLVDRAGPFRVFTVEMVTASHAVLLGSFMILTCCLSKENDRLKLGVSVVDVGLMALLDTMALLLVFLTGLHVPPTLTVILVQFFLPLTAFLTQFVHPDGRFNCVRNSVEATEPSPQRNGQVSVVHGSLQEIGTSSNGVVFDDDYDEEERWHRRGHPQPQGTPLPRMGGLSAEHVWGSCIIFLAVLVALLPAFYAIAEPDFFAYADTIPIRTAYNTLLYVSSCIPAAASQLYKEHVFLQSKQPVNMNYLNLLLSIFEFVFAGIMTPLFFGLQGLGARGDWTKLYPSSNFGENVLDGLRCYFWKLSDEDQLDKYYDDARCDFALGLVVFYSFSIICVGLAVDKIVNAGATKVMNRGMSAGIILAVLLMYDYDLHIPEFSYGPVVDGIDLASLILLVLGSEVYHRVGLKESAFETTYPEIRAFFYDDE